MNLNDLSKTPLNDAVDFENLPSQGGGGAPPPYPGPKRFKLPKTLSAANFKEYELEDGGKKRKRLQLTFTEGAPLVIIQSDPLHQEEIGTTFRCNLNNNARERGRRGSGVFASDLDYLLQALGQKGRPASNYDWATAILAFAAKEAEFAADVEWSWGCSDKRDAWFDREDGSSGPVALGDGSGNNRQGCGAKYYQGQIEDLKKAQGSWPVRITCSGTVNGAPCGASVRAFGNLNRFRA